jgi:tetratricopeptide (TPR) repeat protein
VVEGLALSSLDRREEAIEAYRQAVPVFERLGLWSNYVGAINSIGTALAKTGRLSEARREYARALRHLSRDQHRGWVALLRHSLAEVLYLAGRYREAAISLARARRLYAEAGLVASALKAALLEIESWARAGEIGRAFQRLEIFQLEVSRLGVLDGSITRRINEALSGADPDFERLADVRKEAADALKDPPKETSA